MRGGECLDKLDQGKVAHCLRTQSGRYLDGDGNAVVIDLGFKFMRVPWNRVCLLPRLRIGRGFNRVSCCVELLPLPDHELKLLDEHVFGITSAKHKVLERG